VQYPELQDTFLLAFQWESTSRRLDSTREIRQSNKHCGFIAAHTSFTHWS